MESSPLENPQKPMNLPRFLLALLLKPRQAFTQLDQTGKPHFLWAAAAMILVIWAAAIVTLPITRREAVEGYDAMMQQTGDSFSEQQRAVMEQSREFSTNPAFLVASSGIVETIGYPILLLSAAGVLYLLSLAFGGQARFPSVLSMSVWATVAGLLSKITLTIGTLAGVKDVSAITPGAAALVPILSRITIFEIWYLVLIGIGIGVCARVTRAKSAIITILYWLISLIPPVAMAAVSALIASATLG
jgi:hypothetical protein